MILSCSGNVIWNSMNSPEDQKSQYSNLFSAAHTHGTCKPLRFPTSQINEDSVIFAATIINQSVGTMPSTEGVHQLHNSTAEQQRIL